MNEYNKPNKQIGLTVLTLASQCKRKEKRNYNTTQLMIRERKIKAPRKACKWKRRRKAPTHRKKCFVETTKILLKQQNFCCFN